MFSLRLADTSGTFAKRRSLGDEGRLPEQRMPHTIPGVWNLSGGGRWMGSILLTRSGGTVIPCSASL